MAISKFSRRWSELQGLAVTIPSEGRRAGTLEDFYFDPGTNEVYALRVKTGFLGYKALLASAIHTIESDVVTVASEQMLSEEQHDGRLAVLQSGQSLLSHKVIGEKGGLVGTVKDILINTSRPIALRIVGFELSGGLRNPTFSANEVVSYKDEVIVIMEQTARSLR